jgi:putative toxin-antitoxin system antitoxin component (TIGR02293 family)
MICPDRIAEIMGGKAVLLHRVRSVADLETLVSAGLPKRALRITAERVYSSVGEARKAMFRIVKEATYKRRTRLSPSESERTERLARVIAAAEFAWSDRVDAREWLSRPHPELGNKTPLDAALSELGARQVEDLLERLIYGVPA